MEKFQQPDVFEKRRRAETSEKERITERIQVMEMTYNQVIAVLDELESAGGGEKERELETKLSLESLGELKEQIRNMRVEIDDYENAKELDTSSARDLQRRIEELGKKVIKTIVEHETVVDLTESEKREAEDELLPPPLSKDPHDFPALYNSLESEMESFRDAIQKTEGSKNAFLRFQTRMKNLKQEFDRAREYAGKQRDSFLYGIMDSLHQLYREYNLLKKKFKEKP